MKYLFAIIALLFVLSCDDKTENISDNDEINADTEVGDDSMIEEPVGFEQYENKEHFTNSFKVIDDGFDPYTDIIFGDTFGNLYYSKKHTVTSLKNGSPLKDLLKLDPDGILVWQMPFDLYDISDMYVSDYEFSVSSASIIVSGIYFNGETSAMFVAKLSADGVQSWLKFWGTESDGWGSPSSIAIDSNENIYVGGLVIGALEGTTAAEDNNNNTRNSDAFVTKWDKDGNLLWNKQSTKLHTDAVRGIAVDGNDDVFITGTENIDHGDYSTMSSNLGTSMFLTKWNSDGNEIWRIQNYYENVISHGVDIAIIDKDVVVLGHKCIVSGKRTYEDCSFNPYLSRYNSEGKKIWEKRWRGKDGEASAMATAVKVTVRDNKIYTILDDWGPNAYNSDIMITVFSSEGTLLLSQTLVSACQDYPGQISVLPEGLVMITGTTDGWFGNDLATAECETETFRPFAMILEPLDQ